jgi:hypothetical protein
MTRTRWIAVSLAALLAISQLLSAPVNGQAGSPLTTVADVPMPGAAVRFDYQSLDTSTGRLYLSHMNANQLVVFDVKKRIVVGILTVPRGFTAYGLCRSWAASTLRPLQSTKSL